MVVKLYRKLCRLLQCAHKLGGSLWNKESRHILDTDGVCTERLYLLCKRRPVFKRISISQCIGKSYLRMTALFLCSLYRSLKISKVIKTVKYPYDIDTVCDGLLYEVFHNIISIRLVAKDILSSEEHLKLRILEALFQFSQTNPRILLQETKAGVKGRSAPALNGVVAYLVHLVDDGKHLLCGHPRCDQ